MNRRAMVEDRPQTGTRLGTVLVWDLKICPAIGPPPKNAYYRSSE